jgi:hypothetical protein
VTDFELIAAAYTIGLNVDPTWRRLWVARLNSDFSKLDPPTIAITAPVLRSIDNNAPSTSFTCTGATAANALVAPGVLANTFCRSASWVDAPRTSTVRMSPARRMVPPSATFAVRSVAARPRHDTFGFGT